MKHAFPGPSCFFLLGRFEVCSTLVDPPLDPQTTHYLKKKRCCHQIPGAMSHFASSRVHSQAISFHLLKKICYFTLLVSKGIHHYWKSLHFSYLALTKWNPASARTLQTKSWTPAALTPPMRWTCSGRWQRPRCGLRVAGGATSW